MTDITVTVAPVATVAVTFTSPQGPAGPQGITGKTGPMGAQITTTFVQSSPASVWIVAHGLGRYPSVSVIDSANDEVEGDLEYVDSNTLILTFTAPFSGEAYLN